LSLNAFSVGVPLFVKDIKGVLSAVTLPVMLLFTGYRLGKIKVHVFRHAVQGVFLRIAGGAFLALLFVKLFSVSNSVLAGVCIMSSSMPSAVNNYIFAERFKADPEFASASIVLGTLSAVITIPVVREIIKVFF
jgi:predicted permease